VTTQAGSARREGRARGGPRTAASLVVGAVCGLAWAAGFRSYMVELAGNTSTVGWMGTFAAVLLPGVITGALLGWADYIRRTGGRRGWRWLALAPLSFAVAPMLVPGAFLLLVTEGLGGGAIAVALLGLGGGYALAHRGAIWPRLVCGCLSVALLAALALATPMIAGAHLAVTEPRGAWVAVLVISFIAVLGLASSIPHLPVVPSRQQDRAARASAPRGMEDSQVR
jgi:hypothetical protein